MLFNLFFYHPNKDVTLINREAFSLIIFYLSYLVKSELVNQTRVMSMSSLLIYVVSVALLSWTVLSPIKNPTLSTSGNKSHTMVVSGKLCVTYPILERKKQNVHLLGQICIQSMNNRVIENSPSLIPKSLYHSVLSTLSVLHMKIKWENLYIHMCYLVHATKY